MYFQFRASVYPAGKKTRVVLNPAFPVQVNPEIEYTLGIKPLSGLKRYKKPANPAAEALISEKQKLEVVDNTLQMDIVFPQEDRYIVRLFANDTQIEVYEIYALEEDLFALTPFKGDNHMHTWMSDGSDSPMYMAAAACRHGYDYCVITDHRKYQPSLIARDFYAETGVDFLVVPGEEIHSPDNPVHIISIGGRSSVNEWFEKDEPAYRAAVEKEMEDVDASLGAADRYAAAACQVIFDKIREAEGASVLCHPHWIIANGFNETEDITDFLFDNKRFDVLELIAGGAYEEGTQMQISYYHDRPTMPVVGSSDSHGCFGTKLEPGNFTIVFAEKLDADSIKQAIQKGLTVAGNQNKLYGSFRLVKYAYFLLKNFYPQHKQQRDQLGKAMLRYASARTGADSDLAQKLAAPRPSTLFDSFRAND